MTGLSRRAATGGCAARFLAWLSLFVVLAILLPAKAGAHVGSPDVFFDGKVGPYPAHIAIHVPPVVPGRAQIEVTAPSPQPLEVSFLPLYSKTAIKNVPPAEPAATVPGEPGLYSGQLWLMSIGAYSIEVRIAGAAGEGVIQIPVNSVATHQLPLPRLLGNLLLGFGGLLSFGLIAIVYAAAGESVLAPGEKVRMPQRRAGLIASCIAAVIVAALLYGGWRWWLASEADFRKSLREGAWPDLTTAASVEAGEQVLHLTLGEKAFRPDHTIPLLADHGKLLHLFLISEPDHRVFAHVHPIRTGGKAFEIALPPLPEGRYKAFCDLTLSDSGISSTAAGFVQIPRISSADVAGPVSPAADIAKHDPDDSWVSATPNLESPVAGQDTVLPLTEDIEIVWKAHAPLRAKHDAHLEFYVREIGGRPVRLEPYMGMLSHGAILREDGAIFAHLHPDGNYSMAAQSFFTSKIARELAKDGNAAGEPEVDHSKMHHGADRGDAPNSSFSLPYEFPQPGNYRVWVQIKFGGNVHTANFTASVLP